MPGKDLEKDDAVTGEVIDKNDPRLYIAAFDEAIVQLAKETEVPERFLWL